MRRFISLTVILLPLLLLSGCQKDSRPELFEMNASMDFTIQAGLNTLETHFYVNPSMVNPLETNLDARGLTFQDVDAILPKSAALSTVFDDIDLHFVRQVSVRIFDPFDPEFSREIFYLDPVPGNTRKVIRPFPGLADVKDLMMTNTYGIEVRIAFRQVTPFSMDMRLDFDLSVKGAE